MNKREKRLAALVAAFAAVWAGNTLYGRYDRAIEARHVEIESAKDRLLEANTALVEAQDAVSQLEVWQDRSLPSDWEEARSLYRAWLSEKAKQAGIRDADFTPSPQSMHSRDFNVIGYTIKASGSLKAVTALLYEFYRSPVLHKITRLQLTRVPGAADLTIVMDIEALSLPRAVATGSLPDGDSQRLKLASVEDYQKVFGDRDLVTAYTPPRPPGEATAERRGPPAPPKFDDAEQAHFTGTVGPLSSLRAWINVRTTGETLRVAAGDDVKVGLFEGEVVAVEPRSLVLKSGDKTIRVALGQSIRSGKEIEGDTAAASEAAPSERRGSSPPG